MQRRVHPGGAWRHRKQGERCQPLPLTIWNRLRSGRSRFGARAIRYHEPSGALEPLSSPLVPGPLPQGHRLCGEDRDLPAVHLHGRWGCAGALQPHHGVLVLAIQVRGVVQQEARVGSPLPPLPVPRPPPEAEGAPGKMLHFPFCEFGQGPALRHLGTASNSVNKAVSYLPKGAPSFR